MLRLRKSGTAFQADRPVRRPNARPSYSSVFGHGP